jgi:hypothetical protein
MEQIRDAVDSFVTDLTSLIQQTILEALNEALIDATDRGPGSRRPGRPLARTTPGPVRGTLARGQKRKPEELEALRKSLLAQIAKHPGQGIEAIAKDMGVATKELALPAKALIAAGAIRTKGQKRATKYFPKG